MKYGNVSKTARFLIDRHLKQLEYTKNLNDECPNFPYLIHIEPTNICNLRCIHCIQNTMKRKRGMMDFKLFKKIVNEISQYSCALTLDMQGEPLLHKQILDFVKYSKEKDLFTSIITNATMLTKEVSKKLIELELDRIMFSFDSLDKSIYEEIRVRSNFENTLKNIINFLEFNVEAGFPVYTCFGMVIEEKNRDKIDDDIKLLYNMPLNEVFAFPMLNMLGDCECLEDNSVYNLMNNTEKENWPVCRVPWDHMAINWNGDVLACPVDFEGRFVIGNIEKETLHEIWNGSKMKVHRNALLNKDYSEIEKKGNLCKHCTCMWNEEYDIRDYSKFMTSFFIREISQLGPKIGKVGNSKKEINIKIKYLNTIKEKLEKKEPL
jgi:radical SAM protein with 4Fe4S-binding SPASM domain